MKEIEMRVKKDKIEDLERKSLPSSFLLLISRSLFIAGESYAGHDVPQLAKIVVETSSFKFNFKGISLLLFSFILPQFSLFSSYPPLLLPPSSFPGFVSFLSSSSFVSLSFSSFSSYILSPLPHHLALGIFVGNPALDMTFDMNNYFPFMLNHALIDAQVLLLPFSSLSYFPRPSSPSLFFTSWLPLFCVMI